MVENVAFSIDSFITGPVCLSVLPNEAFFLRIFIRTRSRLWKGTQFFPSVVSISWINNSPCFDSLTVKLSDTASSFHLNRILKSLFPGGSITILSSNFFCESIDSPNFVTIKRKQIERNERQTMLVKYYRNHLRLFSTPKERRKKKELFKNRPILRNFVRRRKERRRRRRRRKIGRVWPCTLIELCLFLC